MDQKGRVSLPSEFRRVLEAQDSSGYIFIVPQLDHDRAHVGFSVRGYDALIERHNAQAYEDELEMLDMEARLLGQARQIAVDDVGRFVLTQDLRDMLNLDREVAFVGLGAHFELWEPQERASFEADLAARRSGPRRRIDRRGLHG